MLASENYANICESIYSLLSVEYKKKCKVLRSFTIAIFPIMLHNNHKIAIIPDAMYGDIAQ